MDRVIKQLRIDELKRQLHYEKFCEDSKKSGTVVAVLDSGMCPSHMDLYGKAIAFYDFVNRRKNLYDDYGHGTHICGCIGGNGKASNGKYKGIAENSRFVIGKVLDKNGDGQIENMIRAMEWVLSNKSRYHIKILNISIGTGHGYPKEEYKKIMELMQEAWREGIFVVCAAGNSGPEKDSISYIGTGEYCITVGCHEGEYEQKYKNSCQRHSGIGNGKEVLRKPDIVAPGTEICSCQPLNVSKKEHKSRYYCHKSGTSMSTAIVSGIASLFFETHENAENDYCKRKMIYTAKDLGESWSKQGYGMIQPYEMMK